MKRTDLLKRIARLAKATNNHWIRVRQGSKHEVWYYGNRRVVIPGHREINELTAKGILNHISEDET